MSVPVILFYVFAALAIVSALGMVLNVRNTVASAMSLVVTMISLAGIYLLLEAYLVAVVQIMVYAGAIVVLFLFVVMLLNVPREEPAPAAIAGVLGPAGLRIGAVLSLLLGAEMVWALSRIGLGWFAQDPAAASVSSVARIGSRLFAQDGYAFAFEATSILILVAMIGAVVLARKEP